MTTYVGAAFHLRQGSHLRQGFGGQAGGQVRRPRVSRPGGGRPPALALACLVLLVAVQPAAAQDAPEAPPSRLAFSGSLRVRYETLDGQARAGLDPSPDLLSLRTMVLVGYDAGPLRVAAELIDSRAFLGDAGTGIGSSEVNALEPVQVYVAARARNVFGTGMVADVQAGRFTLNLGSRRLVAADDYRNTTNGYTGVRVDLRPVAGGSANAIYVLPQHRLPDDLPSLLDNDAALDEESLAQVLWGGLYTTQRFAGGTALEFGYFRFRERDAVDRATRDRRLHTVGARLFSDPAPGRLDVDLEGMYQRGGIRASAAPAAPELDVRAWFYHLEAGYQWTDAWRSRLAVEHDHASGDDAGPTYRRFDTLFGMRRGDFGPSGIYAVVGRANLRATGVRLELTPHARLDAFGAYRALWLASSTDSFSTSGVRDASGASGGFAGRQLEGRVRYWVAPPVLRLEVNAVWLDKGRFLREAPNAPPTGDTRYLSAALTGFF